MTTRGEGQGPLKPIEIQSGPSVEASLDAETTKITGIREGDLRPVVPNPGETTIVLQRNAKDERKLEAPGYGALVPEAAEKARRDAKAYFSEILSKLSPEEQRQVEILIVGSDAPLIAPEDEQFNSPHRRGLDTAAEVLQGAREALEKFGLSQDQILNLSEFANEAEIDGPIGFQDLEPLEMLRKSPDFVKHLADKYGTGKKFWIAYENDEDEDKEVREKLGAEGVRQIAGRMQGFLRLLAQGAMERHSHTDNKRLIIWGVSHYDTISPFVKVHVLDKPATDYLPIDSGAGVTLEISKDGVVKTQLSGQPFNVKL